jgi:mono/diheme cytochrome c family protein
MRPLLTALSLLLIASAVSVVPARPGPAHAAPADLPRARQGQDSITPAMIALGDSIYHGRVAGGTCLACHGQTAKGVPGLAPDLTDAAWLHGDGSLASILDIVDKGVPKPKEAAAPMLPSGGARLSPAQKRAVAAYVYTLSRPKP